MLSPTERKLLAKLIQDRIATLPATSKQSNMLRRLCVKIETGGELLTVAEIQRALNTAGEPDNRRYRWVVYASDIPVLVDTLNAMQVQHATNRRVIVNV